jgi:hypothetical protein
MVMAAGADTAHMMMMAGLRHARVVFIADDLSAVLAKLAIHRRLAFVELGDTILERAEHLLVVAQVSRLDELDFRKESGDSVDLRVDAFDQHPGKQEIGKHDNAAETE